MKSQWQESQDCGVLVLDMSAQAAGEQHGRDRELAGAEAEAEASKSDRGGSGGGGGGGGRSVGVVGMVGVVGVVEVDLMNDTIQYYSYCTYSRNAGTGFDGQKG